MKFITAYFFADFSFKKQARLFKICLYAFIVVKCVYWLSYFSLLFGDNSLFYTRSHDIGLIKNFAFLLFDKSSSVSLAFIVAAAVLCILNLTPARIPFLSDALLWFFVLNLHNKIYPTLTGGEYLLNQFLLFNIFLSPIYENKETAFNQLARCLHNFASYAVIIQVCVVYLIAGITKLYDEQWMSGRAIETVSQVRHYTISDRGWLHFNSLIETIINFLVMHYQLLFPLLIWFRKIKKPFLILGLLIHIYIALIMGLVSFGIIMLIAYIYFWPQKTAQIKE